MGNNSKALNTKPAMLPQGDTLTTLPLKSYKMYDDALLTGTGRDEWYIFNYLWLIWLLTANSVYKNVTKRTKFYPNTYIKMVCTQLPQLSILRTWKMFVLIGIYKKA